jgi:hypothetical protein
MLHQYEGDLIIAVMLKEKRQDTLGTGRTESRRESEAPLPVRLVMCFIPLSRALPHISSAPFARLSISTTLVIIKCG